MSTVTIATRAEVPESLANAWLQHLRDFDSAHPGCHFKVVADAPDASTDAVFDMLNVTPGFDKTIDLFKKFKLPCDVMVPPNTRIRKGCTLSALMDAMKGREGKRFFG